MLNNKTLWWTLLTGWILGSTYWHVCRIKNLCDELATSALAINDIESEPVSNPLQITDSTQLSLEAKSNFRFAKSGFTPNFSDVRAELDSLQRYLIAYQATKRLTITGSYSPEENNYSAFPDLGIARAMEVKNILKNAGVPDSVINVKSHVDTNIAFHKDSLTGGISFAFAHKALLTEQDLAGAEQFESIFKPMNLYFPTASAQYIKTDQNQKFLMAAKQYLLRNVTSKLLLTGHTDDEDSEEWNLALSKKRALSVKRQFVAAGIAPDRILTTGKGETQPKASNQTAIGKKANRRVTIIVQ